MVLSDSLSIEPLFEIGRTIIYLSLHVKYGMLYKSMGVEVIKCNCHRHRVNSTVLWSLGIFILRFCYSVADY